MSIFSILAGTTVRFKRNSLLDTVSQVKNSLDETVLPSLNDAKLAFATLETKGPLYVKLMDAFYERTGMRKRVEWLEDWTNLTLTARHNLNFLEDQVKKIMEGETYSDALSIQKAQLITAISGIEFVANETLGILVLMLASAQAKVGGGDVATSTIREVEEAAKKVFSLLSSYGQPTDRFKKLFSAIPDAVVTPGNKDEVLAAWGKAADPFEDAAVSGFLPNIPLLVVDQLAEFRLFLFNRDKHNKKLMEQRILYLRTRQAGENTAAIEKQISYYENEVEKLQDKIENFEAKHGAR